MVGQQTLDLYVRVRFFPPQPLNPPFRAGFLFAAISFSGGRHYLIVKKIKKK